MTTKVTVDVNGRYLATVTQVRKPDEYTTVRITSKVHGRYEGSPNPTGQKDFFIEHGPAVSEFQVYEDQLPEAPPAAPEAEHV